MIPVHFGAVLQEKQTAEHQLPLQQQLYNTQELRPTAGSENNNYVTG